MEEKLEQRSRGLKKVVLFGPESTGKTTLARRLAAHFDTVQNPINMMEMEHELVAKNLAEIRDLSDNYLLPDDACASYSLLYRMLDEFEEDLHLHVHLENNILFPKALELEQQLNR